MQQLMEDLTEAMERRFCYYDIGSRGGLSKIWHDVQSYLTTVGFEPEREEYERLKKDQSQENQVLNYALFEKTGAIPFHLVKKRGCSSILKPNRDFLNRFPDSERFNIDKTIEIEATTLDDLYRKKELQYLDFLKVDVEGGELSVLKGGVKLIKEQALGLEVEVEFNPLHEDQALFSDVDQFIRKEFGFEIQDIKGTYWKLKEGRQTQSVKGQLTHGDALYFRSIPSLLNLCERLSPKEAQEKILAAIFMASVYGYPDYAFSLLSQPRTIFYLKEQLIDKIKLALVKHGKSLREFLPRKGMKTVGTFFRIISSLFHPLKGDWSTISGHLGNRKKLGWFY